MSASDLGADEDAVELEGVEDFLHLRMPTSSSFTVDC
jgi:hypothetical protein